MRERRVLTMEPDIARMVRDGRARRAGARTRTRWTRESLAIGDGKIWITEVSRLHAHPYR